MKKLTIMMILIVALMVGGAVFFKLIFIKVDNTPINYSNNSRLAIGLVSQDESEIKRYSSLIDYFNKESKTAWYLVPVGDYGSFINDLQSGQTQAGFAGSLIAHHLIIHGVGLPVFRGEKDGVSTYSALIIARTDSGIDKIEDLQGRRFAFVDPFTTAGYRQAISSIEQSGFNPDEFFKVTAFLGTHDAVVNAVVDGKFDAGAVKNLNYNKIIKNNPDAASKLKIISEFGKFPDGTFVISKRIDYEPIISSIRDLVNKLNNTEEGKMVLEKFGKDRLVSTSVSEFSEINQFMDIE